MENITIKAAAIGAAVAGILCVAVFSLFGSHLVAGNTTANFWDAASYKVSGTTVLDGSRNATLGTVSASGLATLNGGTLASNPSSTSTSATTYTLTQSDIANYDTVLITLSGGATTFTLPASSTVTSFIPTAGDRSEQCWLPLSNTLTFAAGTGDDLYSASSSPADLTIAAGKAGCLKYVRQADSDITVLYSEWF